MKRMLLCSALVAGLVIPAISQTVQPANAEPREFQTKGEDTTYTMRRYVLVLLYRGKKSDKFPKEELEKIQAGHMANITRLAKEGKLLVAGPMGDDTKLRGIFILDAENVEEAKQWVDTDPGVKSGWLRAEFHPWWTARGTVIK